MSVAELEVDSFIGVMDERLVGYVLLENEVAEKSQNGPNVSTHWFVFCHMFRL